MTGLRVRPPSAPQAVRVGTYDPIGRALAVVLALCALAAALL